MQQIYKIQKANQKSVQLLRDISRLVLKFCRSTLIFRKPLILYTSSSSYHRSFGSAGILNVTHCQLFWSTSSVRCRRSKHVS